MNRLRAHGTPAAQRPAFRPAALLTALLLASGTAAAASPAVKFNQLGFLPASQKLAVVPAGPASSATRFSVVFGAPQAAGDQPIKHRQVGGCLIGVCLCV